MNRFNKEVTVLENLEGKVYGYILNGQVFEILEVKIEVRENVFVLGIIVDILDILFI